MTPKHSAHLAGLLDVLVDLIRGYVVMTSAQADAAALWAAHTHGLDAFETTPFLDLTSPEKRCGKTRTLDVLELVVARPWRTIMPSEAVLYRKIESATPTLLLDETDAIFNAKNSNTEPLRAVLNAGNRRGTSVPRCVGPTQQLVDFNIFCPKALAGIGDALPDTITDRSIVIRLARKRPDEAAHRFRRREALEIAEPIQQALASWAQDAVADLEAARPDVPDALDDRAEEAWEPLLAIADLAGGHWPDRARLAALELSTGGDDDEALGPWLLRDIRAVFTEQAVDRISSADLAARLNEIEESPWGDIRGKPLDARALARRLKRFEIRPRTVRFDDDSTAKGYRSEDLTDVFSRYLGVSNRHTVTTGMDTGIAPISEPSHATDEESLKPASANGCDGVTDKNAGTTGAALKLPGDDGYLEALFGAFEKGHVTEGEWRQLSRAHQFIVQQAAA